MKKGFPPIFDNKIKIMILGSFPSKVSLQKKQYYGHSQNQFWNLIGSIVNEPIQEYNYEKRKKTLLKYHIGLWDVINACEREGSLDSKIKNEKPNQLLKIKKMASKLTKICFNGQKAGNYKKLFTEYDTVTLPSSSSAYTKSFQEKLKIWKKQISAFTK